MKQFVISPNQATGDLKQFVTLYPGALVYDPRRKNYDTGPGLPAATTADTVALLRDLRLVVEAVLHAEGIVLANIPAIALANTPARAAPVEVLRCVLAAFRTRAVLRGAYQSFASPNQRRRTLVPHALVFDGFRWHARSRDVEDGAYKDFVLGRLTAVELGPAEEPASV